MGSMVGSCTLILLKFADEMGAARSDNQGDDSKYWQSFVAQFFSPNGSLRPTLLDSKTGVTKAFDVTVPTLAWYFQLHYRNNVNRMELTFERPEQRDLPNSSGHVIECPRASWISWYGTGHQVVNTGRLLVMFDSSGKIVLFELTVSETKEYIDKNDLVPAGDESPDVKSQTNSPKMSKKQQQQQRKNTLQPPKVYPALERTWTCNWGVPTGLFAFLEVRLVLFDNAALDRVETNEDDS